jgi:hypothetical protein
MFVHFINDKPVAIAETKLFDTKNERYLQFQEILKKKGFQWEGDFKVSKESEWELAIFQTKLFTSHENFDTKFYDLINWLAGVEHNRDITKNFN